MSQNNKRADIVMSIYPKHVANIVNRTKNHEFRNYLLPSTITRVWIYETSPTSSIGYCVDIEPGRKPGEIAEDDLDGLNNRIFNEGRTGGSRPEYAYKISALYSLKSTLTLNDLKQKSWLKGPPQKYVYASDEMVTELNKGLTQLF